MVSNDTWVLMKVLGYRTFLVKFRRYNYNIHGYRNGHNSGDRFCHLVIIKMVAWECKY